MLIITINSRFYNLLQLQLLACHLAFLQDSVSAALAPLASDCKRLPQAASLWHPETLIGQVNVVCCNQIFSVDLAQSVTGRGENKIIRYFHTVSSLKPSVFGN
jgi:hypothetical protein